MNKSNKEYIKYWPKENKILLREYESMPWL